MPNISTDNERLYVAFDANAPVDVQVENKLVGGSNTYAEFRAVVSGSNGDAAGDFGIVGNAFNDGSNMRPREVFVIAESSANGLHLRTNADNQIRFSVGLNPTEKMRIRGDGVDIQNSGDCITYNKCLNSGANVVLFSTTDNNGFAGTQSNTPFHLMANWSARMTVYPNGHIKLWNCPAPTDNPQNGGYLFVEDGALKFRGSNGTVTVIAPA